MSSNRLLLELARRYPLKVILNFILGFSGALFNGVGTALIVPLLIGLLGQEAFIKGGPPILRTLFAPFEQIPDNYRLPVMAGTVVLIIILKNITNYLRALVSGALNRALTADLQEAGLKLLLEVDLDFFKKSKAGDLMHRLGGEIARATSVISTYITLFTTVVNILVFIGLLLWISWQLTVAATILMPVPLILTQFLVARAKTQGKQITDINCRYSGGLVELFSGIRLVKSSGNEEREFQRFQDLIREREKLNLHVQMNSAAIPPIGEVSNILVLVVLVLLSRIIFANQLEALPTILLTYLVVLNRLLPFVSQLNGTRASLARAASAVDVVYDLIRRDNKTFLKNGTLLYRGLQEEIRFDQVAFAYPGNSEHVLKDISLTVPKGTTLALVGSSGAGKSTLADLLPRFYDPVSGAITIDGTDLRDFEIRSLRRAMGIVSQDTFLFNDSVRNNITYGCTDVAEHEIIEALKRANAYDFIMKLPKGLDTQIGDRGVMLSGGQRQRLAIARALIQDPEILILDEATSALDTVSERLVQQAIDELSLQRTTLVIAHRLSTVRKAHQIAVMERGQVVELGSHEELLSKNGHYTKLYEMQFAETPQQQAASIQRNSYFSQLSYELRARLNVMLGSLGLLVEGMFDSIEEENELAEQAYESATELLEIVKEVEVKVR